MFLSVFDLFKVGIGPSSSHTVGPMKAAANFVNDLYDKNLLQDVRRLRVELFGSLSATGKGHGTDKAVLLGLEGHDPETVDVDAIDPTLHRIRTTETLRILDRWSVSFVEKRDICFYRKALPFHPNAMRIAAFTEDQAMPLLEETLYSIGGGFVVREESADQKNQVASEKTVPHPFRSGAELLQVCQELGKSIAQVVKLNEAIWRSEADVRHRLLYIWRVMQDCVDRGCRSDGFMPGPLSVKRRAASLYRSLSTQKLATEEDSLAVMDWVNLFALAVNEENASGGRIVTAPTNGAAGIVPAVLHYYARFVPGANEDGIVDFMLTAGAIGMLYKLNASISGAEVGCQGEVGVACSMAAGGLAAVLGGTPEQVEYAAEIGMEHNLGLTCDPIGGLVQVPCIERNAMGAIKALNAARMAMQSDGKHYVSLDMVIRTMAQTGADMKTKYKETARGGLAVNVIEC